MYLRYFILYVNRSSLKDQFQPVLKHENKYIQELYLFASYLLYYSFVFEKGHCLFA